VTTNKLQLPNVTLIALSSVDFEGHKKALDKSCEGIDFGAVKLIWDQKIKNIDDWNYKIIYELHNYVDTDFAMLIHSDGYIINPSAWKDEFLDYDYIGAPWPLPGRDMPDDGFSYKTSTGVSVRVGNSVSLRSRRLLQLPSILGFEWKSYYGNTNEDGFLCVHNRATLEGHGCRFAPLELAKYFSKEHEIEENKGIETFSFHSL
jgi:hypothetical protein